MGAIQRLSIVLEVQQDTWRQFIISHVQFSLNYKYKIINQYFLNFKHTLWVFFFIKDITLIWDSFSFGRLKLKFYSQKTFYFLHMKLWITFCQGDL